MIDYSNVKILRWFLFDIKQKKEFVSGIEKG